MVNEKAARNDLALDHVFAALADATRRRVLEQLDGGAASVSELARPHDMSLPGFMKHLAVLEAAGLIARAKEGRVVRCELDAAPLEAAAAWVSRYERFWGEQLDALGRFLGPAAVVLAAPIHQEEAASCSKEPNSKPPPKSASSGTTPTPPKKSGGRGPSRKR